MDTRAATFALLSRRRFALLLSAGAMAPALVSPAEAATGADRRFETLARTWLGAAFRLSPSFATQTGEHRYDDRIDDLSPAGRAAALRLAQTTLARLDAIDRSALSRANQVDAAMLANELRSQIWTEQTLQSWAWDPLYYHAPTGDAIYGLMAREFAPVAERLESVTARLERLPSIFGQARAQLVPARVPAVFAETLANQNRGLKALITELIEPQKGALSASKRARLDAAIVRFNAAVDEHQAWIETTLKPQAQGDFRIGAEKFDQKLAFTLQSSLSRAEIRQRGDAAVRSVREEMYRVATRALAGREGAPPMPAAPTPAEQQAVIRAGLEIAANDRPPRDRLVETSNEGLAEATAFVRAHDLITLPDAPVRVILMPEFQRGYAVAYCDSPGPLDVGLDTFYAVSPIPDDWTEEQTASFLREYNNRGILDIAVHEAMPGHFVQIWHSNRYPSVLRAVLSSGTFVEGWAVYAEEVMVAQGFRADDPVYRLVQLKVQLRTITNSILDQMIHVDGASQEEVMRFLTETAFQEEREAAGKWVRAQLSSTQLSTYFVGFAEHQEARAEAERRAGFTLKGYHDAILSYGSPPMRYARALLFDEPILA